MDGPRLEWISRNGEQEVFEISSAFVDIGRIPHYCDIAVLGNTVTKTHARIMKVEGGCEILDLGSVIGTFVNGNRIEYEIRGAGQQLHSGDTIRIAQAIEFQYREGPMPAAETEISVPRSDFDVCRINDRRMIIGFYEGGDSRVLRFRMDHRHVEYDIEDILENYPRG